MWNNLTEIIPDINVHCILKDIRVSYQPIRASDFIIYVLEQ